MGRGKPENPPVPFVVDAPPPPHGAVVHAVRPVTRGILSIFPYSGDVPTTCSGDVLARFQRPLERRQNVAGTGCWNVAGTRCVGRVGLSRTSFSAGWDDRDRGPGGSTACATPASPTGATGGAASHAAALRWLRHPLPHLRVLPSVLHGQPPLTGHWSRHSVPHKEPRQSRLSKRIAPSCLRPRLGAQ